MNIQVPILDSHRGQKRALHRVELELQMVASWHMGPGNQTWVLSARALTALSHQEMSPAPKNKLHQKLKSGQIKNHLKFIVKAKIMVCQSGNLKMKLGSAVWTSRMSVVDPSLVRRCDLSGAHHPAGRESRDLGQLSLPLQGYGSLIQGTSLPGTHHVPLTPSVQCF